MNNIRSYELELLNLSPRMWPSYLKKHSEMRGQELNISLAKAFIRVGTLMDFKKFIRLDADEAPAGSPDEFLTFCGVLGFGDYLSRHHDGRLLQILRERANDSRPNVRKAVVLALRRIGSKNPSRFLRYATLWIKGNYLEQYSIISALFESELFKKQKIRSEIFYFLNKAMTSLYQDKSRNPLGFNYLKDVISFSWARAVSINSQEGKAKMEKWMKKDHPAINEVMRTNLQRQELESPNEDWTEKWLHRLSAPK